MVHYYKHHFKTDEAKAKTLAFLKFERECDEANAVAIEYMNRDHLNKTKSKQVDSAIKRWDKDSVSLAKRLNGLPIRSLGNDRVWI